MLSLGFSGQSCECNNCGDRFGWQDKSGIVEETWKEVFNQTCGEQRVLLSYKGQFVASAARVRANEKAMYERLRDALQEPDSWAHGQEYLQGRPDSLNAPYFGYTLERLWIHVIVAMARKIVLDRGHRFCAGITRSCRSSIDSSRSFVSSLGPVGNSSHSSSDG